MHLWRLTFEPLDVVHIWSSSLPTLWVQTPQHTTTSADQTVELFHLMADQQRWNCHTATPHDPADYHQKWPIGVRRKHILFIFRLFDNRIPSTTIPFRQIQQQ
jgi:hypothetical protein